MTDDFDSERSLQKEEFFKRERETSKIVPNRISPKNPGKNAKSKVLTFEQKLALTEQWLEETYPHLFAADTFNSLDDFVLRDIKADYKNNVLKKGYP